MRKQAPKTQSIIHVGERRLLLIATLVLNVVTAYGQKYDITPLVGGVSGGTVKLEEEGVSPNVEAHLQDSFSFGLAGGFRFDADDFGDVCRGCNLVEFRWLRQNTHLGLDQDPLVPTPVSASPAFYPRVSLDNFLVDFTREWPVEDAPKVRPFLTVSLGAAHMSTPESGATRFVFGFGTGVKVFPKPHWGILFQVEYLPIVMHAELERLVCTTGCIFVLGGGVMNRFEFSIGPIFRF